MSAVQTWAARRADRCSLGFALIHHPDFCACSEMGEWAMFTAALRQAAVEGIVHQSAVRRLIRGRIEPKHIGTLYRRAKAEGLLAAVDHERSDDVEGRNSHRLEPVYELRAAA